MSLNRREFMGVMAAATASGLFGSWQEANAAAAKGEKLYEIPKFGNVSFLHFTDCHAQLLPVYFREPSVNLGLAEMLGRPPHFVGEALLKHFNVPPFFANNPAFNFITRNSYC